jgi:hypothetical protein
MYCNIGVAAVAAAPVVVQFAGEADLALQWESLARSCHSQDLPIQVPYLIEQFWGRAARASPTQTES